MDKKNKGKMNKLSLRLKGRAKDVSNQPSLLKKLLEETPAVNDLIAPSASTHQHVNDVVSENVPIEVQQVEVESQGEWLTTEEPQAIMYLETPHVNVWSGAETCAAINPRALPLHYDQLGSAIQEHLQADVQVQLHVELVAQRAATEQLQFEILAKIQANEALQRQLRSQSEVQAQLQAQLQMFAGFNRPPGSQQVQDADTEMDGSTSQVGTL